MRKLYSIICAALFIACSAVNAQTFTVSGGTASMYQLGAPMYTYVLSPRTVRAAYHYPASQLSTIPTSAIISSLAFERDGGTTPMVGNPNFKIYLENQPASSLDLGSGSLTWATVIASATQVYDGDPTSIVGSTGGWKTFPFGTGGGSASTFTYTGGALVVYVEYIQTVSQGTTINWMYATPANGTPTPNNWTLNSTKYGNASATTPNATLGTSTGNHYHLQLNYIPGGPCTAPPVAGTATASVSAPICTGTTVGLGLSTGPTGSGQTYFWQASTTNLPGSYSTITASSSSSGTSVNPATTTYYRAVTTCSGLSDTSAPVQVTVTPPFAAGIYTINAGAPASATNFQSFTTAVAALNCGIAGPVVFNVVPGSGPYTEQIIIPQIGGASAINTVSFNGNGNTLQFNTSVSASRYVIRLDGADHMIIDSLNIVPTNATHGWGIHMQGQADSNIIRKCVIDVTGATSTTAANSGGIVVSNSTTSATTAGNNANGLKIIGNEIIGGYRGIIIYGSAGATNGKNHIIENNIVRDFYADGIVLVNTDSALVKGNDIHRMNRTTTTTFAGIELGTDAQRTVVINNRIHDTHNSATSLTGTAYGLLSTTNDVPAGMENQFINNTIYNFNAGTGTMYGIYNNSSDGAYYYHNTVVLDNASSTAGTTRGFFVNCTAAAPATNIRLQNNLLVISRGGTGAKYLIYLDPGASVLSDNNDLFINSTSGTNATGYFGTGFTTLLNWQGANSGAWDQSSKDLDPIFANVATGNLAPTNTLLDNAGASLGVTADILGTTRGAIPDVGAYEFNNPLDIDLLTIAANNAGLHNKITWATANDEKGDRFEIERSKDGTAFSRIGTKEATGNGSSYDFLDESPVSGINFYRLKMVNNSGTTAYSRIVSAVVNGTGTSRLEAYPNPVTDMVTVNLYGTDPGASVLTVLDVKGTLVKSVPVTSNTVSFSMKGWGAGIYFIKYSDGKNMHTLKIDKI